MSKEEKKYFIIWLQMTNSKAKVCSEWKDLNTGFQKFIDDGYLAFTDAVKNYGLENIELNRINMNKQFDSTNCKFTKKEPILEKYEAIFLDTMLLLRFDNIKEFAKKYNLKVKNIKDCLNGRKRHTNDWIFRRTK
jgi:hypothetical protein